MTINPALFSHKSDEWETPQELFDKLNEEFRFDIDVAASAINKKCEQYFDIEKDGIATPWPAKKTIWCNPPYSNISAWAKKCAEHRGGVAVMLVPARTDTKWFHEFIYKKNNVEVRFIKGRLKFGESKNSAPFPSMVVIFRSGNHEKTD